MKPQRLLAALLVWVILFTALPQGTRAVEIPAAIKIPAAQEIPARAYIPNLTGYPQRFTLSCESRSAVDWAGFWGVSIREKRFLNELPRSDNPDDGFVGDPGGVWGEIPPHSYGVHAEPVAALLRRYGLQAEARREVSWDELRGEIARGRPVIVWVIGEMWPGTPLRYTASDGSSTTVARFEHTMILIGYNPRSVDLVDAFSGQTRTYSVRAFLDSWSTLGRMAVVGGPASTPAPAPTPAHSPLPPSFSHRQYLPLVFGPAKAQAAASPASFPVTYKVKRGEYLNEIARRFGLDWQRLAELNGISFPYTIYTGQVLRLK